MTTRIDAVVFDVDGTLYDTWRMRAAFAPWMLAQLVLSPGRATRALRVIRAYRHAHELLRGARHADLAHAQLVRTATEVALPLEVVQGIVGDWFERAPLPAVARAARRALGASLARLRDSGVRIGVLSDYPPLAKLHALGIDRYVDLAVWAQQPEIGVLKPEPVGLLRVLERLHAAPAHTVYVGDRPEVDEAVAIAAGCRAAILGGRAPRHPGTGTFRDMEQLTSWLLSHRS